MSKYSEFLKKRAESDRAWYFGENNYKAVSNKFFTYKAVLNDDEIIIRTNDVKIFKNNYVLIVGSNDVVYLKDFQVREVHTWCKASQDNFYLVKKVCLFKLHEFLQIKGLNKIMIIIFSVLFASLYVCFLLNCLRKWEND